MYITHGHGDHFFGINALKQRFPDVQAVATAPVVDRMASQFEPDVMDGIFRRMFPGQIPDDPGIAERLDGAAIELEGHSLVPVDTGYTDTPDSTSLHVPSIGLIVAGDVVYNDIHPYLAETTTQTRRQWTHALDRLEALAPQAVVAGHKVPDHGDDPRHIAETRQYLRDFNRLDRETDTPRELFDAMIELHPDRANPAHSGAAPTPRRPPRQVPRAERPGAHRLTICATDEGQAVAVGRFGSRVESAFGLARHQGVGPGPGRAPCTDGAFTLERTNPRSSR